MTKHAKEDIAEFLIALSKKGETAHEVAALASVMRSFAIDLNVPEGYYMDNCGTGGDGVNSFNISTTSAFVLAGAGAQVAKHGNRKISSAAGSSRCAWMHLAFIRILVRKRWASCFDKKGLLFYLRQMFIRK